MKKFPFPIIIFQLFITFIALFVIYLIFALLDMDDFDMTIEATFLIFQPIFAIILSMLTIVACIIVGLPIRFLPKVNLWWRRRPVIYLKNNIEKFSQKTVHYFPEFDKACLYNDINAEHFGFCKRRNAILPADGTK